MGIINWLSSNKEWFFSGIGVLIAGGSIKFIFSFFTKEKFSQSQNSGKNSINIQSDRDININSHNKDRK